MKTTCIFLLAIVVVSSTRMKNQDFLAHQFKLSSELFDDIKTTHLGRAIAGLIQLTSKSPVYNFNPIYDAIDDLRTFLENARELEGILRTQYALTYNSLRGAQVAISINANYEVNQLNAQLLTEEGILDSYQSEADLNYGWAADGNATIGTLATERDRQADAYAINIPRIALAIEGCQEAIDILVTLQRPQAMLMIEVQEKKNAFLVAFKKTSEALKLVDHKQHAIVDTLMELVQDYTDQRALGNVLQLLSDLLAHLKAKKENMILAETAAIAQFETDTRALCDQVKGYQARYEDLTYNYIPPQDALVDGLWSSHEFQTGRYDDAEAEISRLDAQNIVDEGNFSDNIDQINKELSILGQAEILIQGAELSLGA